MSEHVFVYSCAHRVSMCRSQETTSDVVTQGRLASQRSGESVFLLLHHMGSKDQANTQVGGRHHHSAEPPHRTLPAFVNVDAKDSKSGPCSHRAKPFAP